MPRLSKFIAHRWNAFTSSSNDDPFGGQHSPSYGPSSGSRPDRAFYRFSAERSIISSIYTRISIDFAAVQLKHVKLDEQGRYSEDAVSGLNRCLTVEANVDQAAREFRQNIGMSLCDKGYIAVVPVDTDMNPNVVGSVDVLTMRVGEITDWYPQHVKIRLYNDINGRYEDVVLKKTAVAIVTNPLYSIMNEPNSTLQRLLRKLSLLDQQDEQSASGKLDLLFQLPYSAKSESRRQQAEQRRGELEDQLREGSHGIGWIDSTEKVIQLNRSVENNLLKQIEYLTNQLYGQLGITEEIMNGTADEATMLNYMNRTIEPMAAAVSEAFHRTFLSKTAQTQKHAVRYFRDVFTFVPIANIAEIADKFTRNEILSSNEIRQVVGIKPSKEAKADQLVNSNMPIAKAGYAPTNELPPGRPVPVALPRGRREEVE